MRKVWDKLKSNKPEQVEELNVIRAKVCSGKRDWLNK